MNNDNILKENSLDPTMNNKEKATSVLYVKPSVLDRFNIVKEYHGYSSSNDFIVHLITPYEEAMEKDKAKGSE